MNNNNDFLGLICIIGGLIILILAIGAFISRIVVALIALSLINYGLRLRNIPPLQVLVPLFFSRRWF